MLPLSVRLTEPEKAYIAGLFDGEGTIGYYDYRHRHESTAMITNTDSRVMTWLREKVGYGNVCTIRKGYQRRKHVVYHWRIGNKPRVKDFLEAIVPYLIIKKDQADLLLNLWTIEGSKRSARTDAVNARRDVVMTQLKALKTFHLEKADLFIQQVQ